MIDAVIISSISADNSSILPREDSICLGALAREPQSLLETLRLLESAMNWLDNNRLIVPAAHVSAAVDALREMAEQGSQSGDTPSTAG